MSLLRHKILKKPLWLPNDCALCIMIYMHVVSLQTSGRSAVFYGAEKGDLEIVKLLILGGANLSLKDKVLSLTVSSHRTLQQC